MNNFDKIICINLKERKDKYNNVKNVFDKLNLNVDFYYAEKHKTSGRIGCFESHIHVIENCYNNNLNNILIFEDDVINTPNYNENIMIEINNFVKENKWCEYFQLGYTILPHEFINFFTSKKITKNIINYTGNCAHAYILNRFGMERILKSWKQAVYEKEMDLDIYYKEIFANNGSSVCPILFDQNFCTNSDNDIATTLYYSFMRKLSCIQYNFSFIYIVSLIKLYINIFFILLLIIFIFIIKTYFQLYNITPSINKIKQFTNFIWTRRSQK